MIGTASIDLGDGRTVELSLNPLEMARLVCGRHGFSIDAEPMDGGRWWLKAASADGQVTLSKRGVLTEAAKRLIEEVL